MSLHIRNSALINRTFDCDSVNLSASRSLDEVGKPGLIKIWRMISALGSLIGKLLVRHYDICYLAVASHGTPFLKDAPFVLLCKLFCRKIVIHQHNKGMAGDVNRWPFRWMLPLVYRNTKVIIVSWRLYQDIEKVVPRENVVICPNGIKVDSEASSYERAGNEIPRLLFLGNLIESKGVLILLDALKMLQGKGIPFECDIVGAESKDIDSARMAEEVERRGLRGSVSWLGRKTGDEKEDIFRRSDIFVFPTYEDCFPLVLLEALAHRLPVVTTDEGGIPDIVQDGVNGLICERRDPESLADCIDTLLANPDLGRKMGEEGHRIFLEKFTEETFIQRICDIFLNL
ncbi:MAG: glycosyltransferase family 4 protein [Bacteroidales bacterium]|nr:glycosyltransferase family 4 protein [Bacteroidales bacterium]